LRKLEAGRKREEEEELEGGRKLTPDGVKFE